MDDTDAYTLLMYESKVLSVLGGLGFANDPHAVSML